MQTIFHGSRAKARRVNLRNWIWGSAFLIYLFVVTANAIYFFWSDSAMNLYYQILMAYNIYFLVPFCLNALSVILNILTLLPFYLFIRRINFLVPSFWQWLFIFRLAADITGRSYEFQFIKSLFYQDPQTGFSLISVYLLLVLPSYIALYLYAFDREPSLFPLR